MTSRDPAGWVSPILLAACLTPLVCGCHREAGTSASPTTLRVVPAPPAKVANPTTEQALNTITLTEQAEQRLGIRVVETRLADSPRRRSFGGEIVIPPEQNAIISAPVDGTLSAPEGGSVPSTGSRLAVGQPVFRLTPLLTPEREVLQPAERIRVAQTKADLATAKIEADRQLEAAKVTLEAAQIAYDRAVQLLRNKAGSQRAVDEAEAQLKLARENLAAAEIRQRLMSEISLDEDAGQLSVRTLMSPLAGVLQRVDTVPGETVAAGEALFQVSKLDPLWVRVPVYAGMVPEIDLQQSAEIAELSQIAGPVRPARRIEAPSTADPLAITVDLYFELDNGDGRMTPGERVATTLSLRGTRPSLVVPRAAILFDIHGGTWLYEQIAPRTYSRRRIEWMYTRGDDAVLSIGPSPGTKIVVDGAAELFGTEFGSGK